MKWLSRWRNVEYTLTTMTSITATRVSDFLTHALPVALLGTLDARDCLRGGLVKEMQPLLLSRGFCGTQVRFDVSILGFCAYVEPWSSDIVPVWHRSDYSVYIEQVVWRFGCLRKPNLGQVGANNSNCCNCIPFDLLLNLRNTLVFIFINIIIYTLLHNIYTKYIYII